MFTGKSNMRIWDLLNACRTCGAAALPKPMTPADQFFGLDLEDGEKRRAQLKAIFDALDDDQSGLDAEDLSEEKLVPALDWIKRVGWTTTFVLIVLWPALSTPAGVFTKTYFAFWIFVVIAGGFFASVIIVGLPIYESFGEIAVITRALTGLGGGASKDEIALSERGGKSVEA